MTFSANTANANGLGVYLGAGVTAPDSTDTTTSGNTIESGVLINNLDYDTFDASTGAGTSGTANSWYANACTPANDSDPAGLCNATPPPANAVLAAIDRFANVQHPAEVRPAS